MKESLCNLRQNEIFRVFFMSFKTQNTAKTRSKQLSPGEASESMHTIKAKFLKCFLLFHTVIEQKWSYTPMWGNGVVYNKPGATERTQFVRASLEDVWPATRIEPVVQDSKYQMEWKMVSCLYKLLMNTRDIPWIIPLTQSKLGKVQLANNYSLLKKVCGISI